jgi:hypothetical protein
MNAELAKPSISASAAAVRAITVPVAGTYEATDAALLRYAWPPKVLADVKRLVAANAAVIRQLSSVHADTTGTTRSWLEQLHRDMVDAGVRDAVVRRELGLPVGG